MTFAYVLFGVMFTILVIGSILEDRRHTQMEQTIKAILARFDGNVPRAVAYCNSIADHASNPALRLEYNTLGQRIWREAREKELAAHAS